MPAEQTADPLSAAAEHRARAWYAQHIGRAGTWDGLTSEQRCRFIAAAGPEYRGRCGYPDCGGDCLECFNG
jgi:hypothetical protein